ncbi:glutamate mutase L, partial [Desulfovibrio sp. OttesenSCG-928-C14]|nr:glutamate mutase L [Desulfovibrio sp. OttesenSCG-928-C14]
REIKPDIILLAGGTDSGETESAVENAGLIARAAKGPGKFSAKVIVACNIAAQPEVARVLEEAGVPFTRVGNVMPTIHDLNVRPARAAIHAEFIRQITNAPGLAGLADLVEDKEVIPTPAAILMGAELLAGGTYKQDGVGGVLVLDVGGATTDVHSVIPALGELRLEERGLVINNDKQVAFRTVEGNLGLRVSATGIVEAVGPAGVLNLRDRLSGSDGGAATEEECARVEEYARFLEAHTEHLPENDWEKALEPALAGAALEVALRRHAGHWLTEYNPVLGIQPGAPVGRDLRPIKWVIGVGGFFSHRPEQESAAILRHIFSNPGLSLFPEEPIFRVDHNYLLYAMGLLGKKSPDAALAFAREYFKMD